jgi:hypothetical protein
VAAAAEGHALLAGAADRLSFALAAVAAAPIADPAAAAGGGAAGLASAVASVADAVAAAERLARLAGAGDEDGARLVPTDWALLRANANLALPFWVACGTLANATELLDELDKLAMPEEEAEEEGAV